MDPLEQPLNTGHIEVRPEYGGGTFAYKIRLLSESDLEDLAELHRLIHSGLPHPHILRRDEPSYLRQNLRETGITFGAYVPAKGLIAYAALALPETSMARDLCRDLSNLSLLPSEAAVYDGSAVHPAYRGGGLHAHLNRCRRDYAVRGGVGHLVGTVSLKNPYSLGNHLKAGFVVRGIREKYGGMLRLIIHNDMNWAVSLNGNGQCHCELANAAQHRQALEGGFLGYRVDRTNTGWSVLYARPV